MKSMDIRKIKEILKTYKRLEEKSLLIDMTMDEIIIKESEDSPSKILIALPLNTFQNEGDVIKLIDWLDSTNELFKDHQQVSIKYVKMYLDDMTHGTQTIYDLDGEEIFLQSPVNNIPVNVSVPYEGITRPQFDKELLPVLKTLIEKLK